MLQELATRVLDLYGRADEATLRFKTVSGLDCPSGCCTCCLSEKVEATVLEMLPLAFHLFRTRQAELVLKRIERQVDSNRCILFRPDRGSPGSGACSEYHSRALVCRLFGFAGGNDRRGQPRLAFCRIMRQRTTTASADANAAGTSDMPLFHDFGMAITALHPDLGTARRPINIAISEALLKVGLVIELTPACDEPISTGLPPEKPLGAPSRPRRAA
jgi:Fe-S-cluster containining protein